MSLLAVARRAWEVLPPESRRCAWALGAVACLNGIAEVSGVAGILPMVVLAGDPQAVESHPWLRRAYDGLGFESPQAFLVFLGLGFLALFVLVNVTRSLCVWMGLRFSADVSHRLSVRLLRDSLGRPYVGLLGRNGNDLARRLLHEVDGLVANVYRPLTEVVTNGVAAAMVAGALMAMDPVVAAAAALALAGFFTVIYRVSRENLSRLGHLRSELDGQRSRTVHEGLSAVKESRLLSRRARIAELYEEQSRRYQGARVAADLVGEMPRYLTEVLALGSLVSALLFFSLSGRGAVAWMMVCVMATWRLVPALQTLYRNAARVRFYAPALDDLARDLAGEPATLPDPPAPLAFSASLRLRDVHFAYPGTRDGALHGVDLEILAGTRVALVGETGAGKTTVADLVAGALTPGRGCLELDGEPLDEARLPAWHLNVGYVPQEIFLADDSVTRNIALGLPDSAIDRVAVERAARAACIHDFVVGELPQGYDTPLGERGVSLSGGQRQRIGIARALYGRPQLLILDEATSSLDGLTQRRVLEGLREAGEGLTVLVIAHRLEVVKDCDRLYLLDGGRVTAQGAFAELLGASPRFQAMAEKVS